jgi:ribosomal-protein-alanine N-acetyltransferase
MGRVTPAVELRAMLAEDLDAVLANERSAYSHPWSRQIFVDCLASGYQCRVLQGETGLLGHAVSQLCVDQFEIFNLCLHPSWQGRGLGRLMLRSLLSAAVHEGAVSAFLEVRASNHAALRLYAGEGFVESGRRVGYYPAHKGREDALLMARTLFLPESESNVID